MSNQLPIYSQVLPKNQGHRSSKQSSSHHRAYSSLRGDPRNQPPIARTSEANPINQPGFDPLNFNHGGNFHMVSQHSDKPRELSSHRRSANVVASRRNVHRSDMNEGKVEAYLRQNQISIKQHQMRHSSAVKQAEHRVNLRSLPLGESQFSKTHHQVSQDRTPTEGYCPFPGQDNDLSRCNKEHCRERDLLYDIKENMHDPQSFQAQSPGQNVPNNESAYRQSKKTSLNKQTTPTIIGDKRKFFCREWAFQKIAHCLEQRPVSKTCGALILGDAGSGKTALCRELSAPGSGPAARQQRALSRRMLARHFLQNQNENSLTMAEFIRTIVMQILNHSTQHQQFLMKTAASSNHLGPTTPGYLSSGHAESPSDDKYLHHKANIPSLKPNLPVHHQKEDLVMQTKDNPFNTYNRAFDLSPSSKSKENAVKNMAEEEELIQRLNNVNFDEDVYDGHQPHHQEDDHYNPSHRAHNTMEGIHEKDHYDDLLSSAPKSGHKFESVLGNSGPGGEAMCDTEDSYDSAGLVLQDTATPSMSSVTRECTKQINNEDLDYKLYENHENLFLRNESQRHSKEIRTSRIIRQHSEPVERAKPSHVQKSLSTDAPNNNITEDLKSSDISNDCDAGRQKANDDIPRRQEVEYAEVQRIRNQNLERVSRIPIANFKYPNRNIPSVENSPSKRQSSESRGDRSQATEPILAENIPDDDEELPEYQNVMRNDEDKNTSQHQLSPYEKLLEREVSKASEQILFEVQLEEDVPPPIPSLPVSPRTLIANAYYEKLLGEPDIQQALLPHNLEKNPDDCFKKALLFPLLEIDPPKQCLFILVDSVDEGSLTGPPVLTLSTLSKEQEQKSEDNQQASGRSLSVSRTVAELLANHHHLFPQWLLLVCTARKQSKCLTKMFTGFRKISLDSLHKAHVSADVQRYMVARLDASPRLRARLTGPQGAPQHAGAAIKALDHLRIKSDGCLLYLEKVLDGVADGFIALREIKEIPGTLNGLYLWLCQRLFHGRRFSKVRPLLDILLVAKCGVTETMLYTCLLTANYTINREDFAKRLHLLRRILVLDHTTGCLSLFHPSFGAWLLDVKHCTRKFHCSPADGHAALSMYYTLEAKRLTALEIHNYVLHMTRLEQHLLAQKKNQNELSCKISINEQRSPSQPETVDTSSNGKVDFSTASTSNIDLHTLVLLWIIDSGCNIETSLRKENTFGKELNCLAAIQEQPEVGNDLSRLESICNKTPSISQFTEVTEDSMPRLNSHHSLGASSMATTVVTPNTTNQSEPLPEFLTNFYWPTLPRDTRVLRALLEMGAQVEAGPLLPSTVDNPTKYEENPVEELALQEDQRTDGSIHLVADITASQLSLERQLVSEARRPSDDENKGITDLQCLQSPPPPADPVTGRSVVHELAQRGEIAMLKIVLERWPELADVVDCRGSTPLAGCARRGGSGIPGSGAAAARILLACGADADCADADGWTPLRAAAWGGHTEVVEVLLEHGCDVDCVDADNRTALRAASWSGHASCVELLIAAGADVSRSDAEGRTPLIAAAYMGHADIVAVLLEAGADYDHYDEDGRTALSVACLCAGGIGTAGGVTADGEGCVRVVQLLLEKGADPRIADKDGATPLIVAAFEGHKEICELLLEYDAELDAADGAGRTALWASAGAGHASATATLLFWGACIDTVDLEGRTVLSIAAAQGNVDVVRQLLDRGLDEQHRDNSGWTPLHYAAFEGHLDVCEALLEAGAKVDECDNDGKGALMLAAQEGHVRLVEMLIREWGAPVDQRAHDGKTSLRLAALEGHGGCVKTLVALGANVDAADADGRSIVYVLALDNRLAMAKYLIQRCGANVEIADTEGRTPLHVSAWQGHQDMVNVLLSVGANPDARDADLRTALHSAAWRGRSGAVRSLLAAGATVAPVCGQGATPLGIAAQEGHEDCVLWLLQHGADPRQPDHCGRTPARVALRAGHSHICRLLESWPRSPQPSHNQMLLPQAACSKIEQEHDHSPTNTSGSTAETKQCTSSLMNSRLSPTPIGVLNQSSPDWKRRSVQSSNSTKSSSNVTSGSSKSSQQDVSGQNAAVPYSSSVVPSAPPALQVSQNPPQIGKASRANLALSFAQQVARCSRGAIGGWRNRSREKDSNRDSGSFAVNERDNYVVQSSRSYMQSERDADMMRKEALNGYDRDGIMSPLYASPPHSPISDVCSPTQPSLPSFGQQNNLPSNPTDNHFNRDTHMRIILGRDSKNSPPAENRESGVKSKRNGIVTNPALRLVANMKNGLDNAAANLRRTGVALAASASSANPAVKTNAFQWRRETPL